MRIRITTILLVMAALACTPLAGHAIDGFTPSQPFNEQIAVQTLDDIRILTSAANGFDPAKPTQLIIYALPNGNSIEQTIGCAERQGLDWHYFIQQIAAQTRALRAAETKENIVVAYVEATVPGFGKTWPGWRQKHADGPRIIRNVVDTIAKQIPGEAHITLCAHSGGGAFILGYVNSADAIDDRITRIAFLDANYSYHDNENHGDKLLKWLGGDKTRRLVVICYDDRNIEISGKPVVTATGGTWRATFRMIDRFKKDAPLDQGADGLFDTYSGMNGQIRIFMHRNPDNLILHTRLVGEMNGFMTALTIGTEREVPLHPGGDPALYSKWIAPDPIALGTAKPQAATTQTSLQVRGLNLAPRPSDAITGSAFIARVSELSRDDREYAIFQEIKRGNVPDSMRTLVPVRVRFMGTDGIPHLADFYVTPDYVSIGSNEDFVRMPMLPKTAQWIADISDCSLPTRKMVDEIDAQAALWLEPQPLVEQREAPATFLQHQQLIEAQRAGRDASAIICGIKKDIVITNRLQEKPNRVAIYGWRKPDGNPIQPLTIVHNDTYVDYSHGVRLISRHMLVDGNPMVIEDVLKDPELCGLISDEGVIEKPDYR